MSLPLERHEACAITPGSGRLRLSLKGETLTVFTYRPRVASGTGVLVMFDGLHRDAQSLRDKAAVLAEATGLIAFVPLLDRERFPKWRYDNAGVVKHGALQSRSHWTAPLLQQVCDEARSALGSADARLYLFGHSAGGQLLSRVCAYSPLSDIQGVVITNPSAYVAADLEEAAPFGFADIFPRREALARLQVYLALPITIYLGCEDVGTRHLAKTPAARRQGASRFERGHTVYEGARALARRRGWACNWRLVEVPGVGHSSRAMLKAPQCAGIFVLGGAL